MIKFVLPLVVFTAFQTQSVMAQSIERSTADSITCNEEYCTYQVKNKSQALISALIRDATEMTFGNGFIDPSQDYTVKQKGGQILVKISDSDKRTKFLKALQIFDTLDDMKYAPPEIEISFRVFAMESSRFNNFQVGLANSQAGSNAGMPRVGFSPATNSMASSVTQLNLGNLTSSLFSLFFDMSRINSWSIESEGWVGRVTNGESLNVGKRKPIYNKDVSNSTQIEKGEAGFSFNGRVSTDNLGEKVTINGFSMRYTSPTSEKNTIFEESSLPRGTIQFNLDQPYILFTQTRNLDSNSKGNNFILSASDSKNSVEATLVIVVTAHLVRPVSATLANETGRAEMKAPVVGPETFESNPNMTFASSIKSLTGFVIPSISDVSSNSLFGQLAGIRLSTENVSSQLANKIVAIRETNLISKQSTVEYVQLKELASAKGYQFTTLRFEKMQPECQRKEDGCQLIPIELEIKDTEGSTSANVSLFYYPILKTVRIGQMRSSEENKTNFLNKR